MFADLFVGQTNRTLEQTRSDAPETEGSSSQPNQS